MAPELLPYKYGEETRDSGLTALGGLPLHLDLAKGLGLVRSIREHLTRVFYLVLEDVANYLITEVIHESFV